MRFLASFIAISVIVSLPLIVRAQFPSPQSGITVTPSIIKLDLAESSSSFLLTYKNTTQHSIELSLSAEDFTALEEGWKVKFLDEDTDNSYRYTLSSWIKFETSTLLLNPSEEREVKVFIDAQRLSPGGHYASILAEIKPGGEVGHIGLRGILSSLVFVRTASGSENEAAMIKSFSGGQTYGSFPTKYAIQFHNTGNVDLAPYGKIDIKDMFGRTVATGILNEESLITLPESIREYQVMAATPQTFLLPGFYTAHLNLHYGKTNQQAQKTFRFFSLGAVSLPYVALAIGAAIALVILFVVRSRKLAKSKS